jgi:hypothetical protein
MPSGGATREGCLPTATIQPATAPLQRQGDDSKQARFAAAHFARAQAYLPGGMRSAEDVVLDGTPDAQVTTAFSESAAPGRIRYQEPARSGVRGRLRASALAAPAVRPGTSAQPLLQWGSGPGRPPTRSQGPPHPPHPGATHPRSRAPATRRTCSQDQASMQQDCRACGQNVEGSRLLYPGPARASRGRHLPR